MVVVDLEDVELGVSADGDEGEPDRAVAVGGVDRGVEDVSVEGGESVGVIGEDGDVVDAVGEHGLVLSLI